MKTAIKSTLKRLINGPRTEKELTCGDVAETSHANHTIRRLNEAEQQGFCVYVNDTWMLTQSGRDALAKKKEPLEYWNAVEGWVKIDEVREHFDSVGCATIYKTAGEGRVPLSLCKAQPEQEPTNDWSEWRGMVVQNLMRHGIDKDFARRLAHFYQDKAPQPKEPEQEPVACIRRNKYDEYRLDVTDNFKVTDLPVNVELLLYTTPPQRKPLTPEQIAELDCLDHFKFARAIEAAHGIKE